MPIVKTEYFNAGKQSFGENHDPHPLDLMTVCVLTMDDETVYTGRHVAEEGSFNEKAGQIAARKAAMSQMREIEARNELSARPEGLPVDAA